MGFTACGLYGVIQRQISAEITHTVTIAAPIMNVFECSRPRTSSARRARRSRGHILRRGAARDPGQVALLDGAHVASLTRGFRTATSMSAMKLATR